MKKTHLVVRTLSVLGIAAAFAACSSFGASGVTPRIASPDSQSRSVQSAVGPDVLHAHVYVANIGSNNVSAYTINATSGALTKVAGVTPAGAGHLISESIARKVSDAQAAATPAVRAREVRSVDRAA